jgi:mRNA interferase RelE/StbE
VKYEITFKKTASKEVDELPNKIAVLVMAAIFKLADTPRPAGCKKLKGKRKDFWRIRIGDYRVIYTIDNEIKIIDIQKVGHRQDIYE